MTVWIGTSGWQYRHWHGRFYPAGLAQRALLAHYAERFATWRRMPTRPGDGPGSARQRDWWHLRKG